MTAVRNPAFRLMDALREENEELKAKLNRRAAQSAYLQAQLDRALKKIEFLEEQQWITSQLEHAKARNRSWGGIQ